MLNCDSQCTRTLPARTDNQTCAPSSASLPYRRVHALKRFIASEAVRNQIGGNFTHKGSNLMSSTDSGRLSRRAALKITAGLAAASATVGATATTTWAHDLRPADSAYRFDEYERVVNRDVTIRMLYEWPNLTNPLIFSNISNGLNGFQFSYDLPPSQIQVVVQAYATANLAMYDDAMWA
jgi:hypothetical protein